MSTPPTTMIQVPAAVAAIWDDLIAATRATEEIEALVSDIIDQRDAAETALRSAYQRRAAARIAEGVALTAFYDALRGRSPLDSTDPTAPDSPQEPTA